MSAYNAGGTGYIATIYATVLLLIYAGIILQIIRVYPNKNIYEVLQEVVGTWIAKVIIFLYALWAYVFMLYKVGAYSITLQATLMPSIHPGILIVILFLLIIYALTKNERTIFRFAEFLYQPTILFLAIIFVFALPSIQYDRLIPVNVVDLTDNLYSLPDICSIGGNLVLILFFCKKLVYSGDYKHIKKRIILTVLSFCVITILSSILSIGINGVELTTRLSYPMFQAIKSVSIIHTFERFDSFLTMICMMSDFVGVVVFLQITMLCLGWVFTKKKETEDNNNLSGFSEKDPNSYPRKIIAAVLLFIASIYILLRDITQFEFETFYRNYIVYLNLAFQYIVPLLLGFLCIGKQIARNRRERKYEKYRIVPEKQGEFNNQVSIEES